MTDRALVKAGACADSHLLSRTSSKPEVASMLCMAMKETGREAGSNETQQLGRNLVREAEKEKIRRPSQTQQDCVPTPGARYTGEARTSDSKSAARQVI